MFFFYIFAFISLSLSIRIPNDASILAHSACTHARSGCCTRSTCVRVWVCAWVWARMHLRPCVSVPWGCTGPLVVLRGPAVFIYIYYIIYIYIYIYGRPDTWSFRVGCMLVRGRRRDVDMRGRQRAVGCALLPHVRRRRRRRDLRHRRLEPHHPLPGRVGEHRQRCELYSKGYCRGDVSMSVYFGVRVCMRATTCAWVPRVFRLGVLKGYSHHPVVR
jgi:hypothetical protein